MCHTVIWDVQKGEIRLVEIRRTSDFLTVITVS